MQRGEINADPVQGEFFTPEGLADGLVREVTQNSLDAASGTGPVRIRFAYPTAPLSTQASALYSEGLREHLAVALAGAQPPIGPTDFIVIEDFGTRGLRGDPEQDDDTEPGTVRNDFFYFWRNVGRSNKSETDRGRWGLGKTVLPASSRINTFFGLTVRANGSSALLMGQAVLKIHRIGTVRYAPYGYFARAGTDGFPMPFDDEAMISRFVRDFNLDRQREAGLSMVIPFPRIEELQPVSVIRSAVLHYFYPILAGDLIIDVCHDGIIDRIDRDTIGMITASTSWNGTGVTAPALARLFDLARWAIATADTDHVSFRSATSGAPNWDKVSLDAADLAIVRDRFERGERVALRVPMKVHRIGRESGTSFFAVYLEKDETLRRGQDHYIRQGITISEIHALQGRGAWAIAVIEDRELSAMLGDSENPAHTDWLARSGKLKERYVHGPSGVSFVKTSVRQIVDLLTRLPEGLDRDLLRDMFYVDVPEENTATTDEGTGRSGRPGDDGPQPPGDPPPASAPRRFRILPLSDGFRISGRPESGVAGAVIDVEVAYEVRRGNPFARYDECDFRIDQNPIRVIADGVYIEDAARNRLRFLALRDDFDLHVTGFDPRRDLRVRAIPERVQAETSE